MRKKHTLEGKPPSGGVRKETVFDVLQKKVMADQAMVEKGHPSMHNGRVTYEVVPQEKKDAAKRWMKELSESLIRHCEEKGYPQHIFLADELGIKRTDWKHIITGEHLVLIDKGESYAKLYKFGVKEADPRKLPPKYQWIPNSKFFIEVSRSWTERDLSEFLAKFEISDETTKIQPDQPPKEIEPIEEKPSEAPLPSKDPFWALLALPEELIERITCEVTDRVLAQIPQPGIETKTDWENLSNLGEMAKELRRRLEPFMSGTPQQREELYQRFGRDLAKLLPILDSLTKEKSAREKAIENQERFKF